jgi:osmotically-inducible protein OsmY
MEKPRPALSTFLRRFDVTERKGDRETREKILRELELGGLTGLRVEVHAGRVALRGTVDSYAKQLAARDAAHRAAGTLDLEDNVQVRLPGASTRSDPEIAAAVARALEFDEFVPDRKIRLSVTRGCVTLEGIVDVPWEREDAARVARHVHGVSSIANRIRVRSRPEPRV